MGSGSDNDAARRLWKLSAMGGELAFGIVGMVLLGLGVDYLAGTSPWGVVVGTVLGVLGAGYNFIRQALRLTRASGVVVKPRQSQPQSEPAPRQKGEMESDELRLPDDFDRY